jgi:hypothetical protein
VVKCHRPVPKPTRAWSDAIAPIRLPDLRADASIALPSRQVRHQVRAGAAVAVSRSARVRDQLVFAAWAPLHGEQTLWAMCMAVLPARGFSSPR